jgi:hypothetical protein
MLTNLRDLYTFYFGASTYVISYPKSGRTWLRGLIGKYLALKFKLPETEILATHRVIAHSQLPALTFSHDGTAMIGRKNYRQLSYNKSKYRNKNVLLLGRDPKDTLVSAYFQATRRRKIFAGSIEQFIKTETFGILKIIRFYQTWKPNLTVPRQLLFLRYEDLHRAPQKSLFKVLQFIGEAQPNLDFIDQAIAYCSFEHFKRLEAQDKFQDLILKPIDSQDPESFKVRQGKIGGHRDYLSPTDIDYLNQVLQAQDLDLDQFS